ncbi:30S ribosomal protein S6 [Candidatus Gottesmanbacteria bacterium]|nr:30S ribosomal protein S6 [Candidatus Gottesmanbacteria bacterium]MBI5452635.1 30S ribosomal protein S6 [Candidatus Gottesmanbacteria bacterium]
MLNPYELVLIFKTSVSEDNRKKTIEELKKLLKTSGQTDVKDWGKRQFAYPIKKEKEGNYYLLTADAEGKEVAEVSNRLKLNEDVLRYLLVRLEPAKKEKKAKKGE